MILVDALNNQIVADSANQRMDVFGNTFKSVEKLVESVKELEKELKEGEFDYFRVIADLLIDVQGQMVPFEPFVALPHVALVKSKVNAIETELRRQVQWSFREVGQLVNADFSGEGGSSSEEYSTDLSSLTQVHIVVDALGEKFRKDLLERFAQLQLIPYEKHFKFGSRLASLEEMECRFAWFKHLLRLVDAKMGEIFPSELDVCYHLFVEFSRRTKKHINEVLTATEKEGVENVNEHVAVILRAVKQVLTFEAEIKASFTMKNRVEAVDKEDYEFTETIVDAFDPFLGNYVQLERKGLDNLMEEMTSKETQEQHEQKFGLPHEKYESAQKMFEYIKGSLKRCNGFSTGITFLSLSKEFRICLQQYAETLKFRCASPSYDKLTKEPCYIITKQQETVLLRVIGTSEYCVDTLPGLETMMKQRIQPAYRDDVDFGSQKDAFMETVSHAMRVLAEGEIYRQGEFFEEMKKVQWGIIETVGDMSEYARKMFKVFNDCVPRIRSAMTSVYFLNVCAKLATVFLQKYQDQIMHLRRVCMVGGAQLGVDLNGLKEFLLRMPNVKRKDGEAEVVVSKVYVATINKKAAKIESILKLLSADEKLIEETFAAVWPDGTKEDLQSVMAIRGSGKNILPMPLSQVSHDAKKIVKGVDTIAKDGLSTNFKKMGEGMKSAFTDITGAIGQANLFSDGSTHSNEHSSHSHATTNSKQSSAHPSSGTHKTQGDLKNVFTAATAAMGFKKGAENGAPAPTSNKHK